MREGTRKSRAPSGVDRHSMGVSTSMKSRSSRKPRMARIVWCRSFRFLAMRGRLHHHVETLAGYPSSDSIAKFAL